jgi:hypothetical protein
MKTFRLIAILVLLAGIGTLVAPPVMAQTPLSEITFYVH